MAAAHNFKTISILMMVVTALLCLFVIGFKMVCVLILPNILTNPSDIYVTQHKYMFDTNQLQQLKTAMSEYCPNFGYLFDIKMTHNDYTIGTKKLSEQVVRLYIIMTTHVKTIYVFDTKQLQLFFELRT